ncbi:Uncharacterised protein [Mycobacteroides abscessus subsp. abscessus]|nr:Uncharacterised protein [Mycobacteroides abscessus subsp. abscessus]SIA78599.1 Uncharacterised protein [Mycobacteroides abscessus subsp. abscessus]SKQ88523.1 Uncharacterised protein [Mycobacteroides abscessus subsp. abscessus]
MAGEIASQLNAQQTKSVSRTSLRNDGIGNGSSKMPPLTYGKRAISSSSEDERLLISVFIAWNNTLICAPRSLPSSAVRVSINSANRSRSQTAASSA